MELINIYAIIIILNIFFLTFCITFRYFWLDKYYVLHYDYSQTVIFC